MAKEKVFVSFDYENDRQCKFLLQAWNVNEKFEFVFAEKSYEALSSDNIGRIKYDLTLKIKEAKYTLAVIGKYANKTHRDSRLIGDINWVYWEIKKSMELGNKLVAVKIDQVYESPTVLGKDTSWATSLTQHSIMKAIEEAL